MIELTGGHPWQCLLVADSLRYDVFCDANMEFINSVSDPVLAQAQGTFTWPAHQAMMVGHLPHCFDEKPLYNRYCRQLWRLGEGPGTGGSGFQEHPQVSLPPGKSIVEGFGRLGYATIGSGAVSWFTHPYWAETFQYFRHLTGAEIQFAWVQSVAATIAPDQPVFLFINFGETHEPYSHAGMRYSMPEGYQTHKLGHGPLEVVDFDLLRERQRLAASHLDGIIAEICAFVPKGSRVVFTADHGECFGEDGYFGHGFLHEKVMEVPLSIFTVI
jgi:arylsulfatase A-like enzyme